MRLSLLLVKPVLQILTEEESVFDLQAKQKSPPGFKRDEKKIEKGKSRI